MKFMIYYENKSSMDKAEYQELKEKLQKEHPNEFKTMHIRQMEFVNVIGYISKEEELAKYYIKMRNDDENAIYLEKKSIQGKVVYKNCCKISRQDCEKIICGDIAWMKDNEQPLINDLYLQISINGLEIGQIKEIEREVYSNTKDCRLVFDSKIERVIGKDVTFFSPEGMHIECLFAHQVQVSYRRMKTIPRMIANMLENQEQVMEDYAFA